MLVAYTTEKRYRIFCLFIMGSIRVENFGVLGDEPFVGFSVALADGIMSNVNL
jgi:hypothetical protein